MHSRLSAFELLDTMRLLHWDRDTSKDVLFCDERFWRWGKEGFVVGIAGAWDLQSMDIVLRIPYSPMVTARDWMLIARKGRGVKFNNLLYVPVDKDYALLSFVAASGGRKTNTKSCGLEAAVFCT